MTYSTPKPQEHPITTLVRDILTLRQFYSVQLADAERHGENERADRLRRKLDALKGRE